MPLYEFIDTATQQVFERTMKIAEYEQFLKDNPSIQRYHGSAPNLAGSAPNLNKSTDAGWKETLARIHQRSPGSTLNQHSSVQF